MSTYIDVEFISPQSTANIDPPIDIYSDVTFTWAVTASSLNPTYRPEQVSAVFGWRLHSGDPWNETSISGSEKSVTIPANTFSAGGFVFTRVIVIDASGTTKTGYGSYYPLIAVDIALTSGAGIRSGAPNQNFTWAQSLYKSLGALTDDYEQRSLFMFDTPPAAYKFKKIVSGGLYCKFSYTNNTSDTVIGGDIYALSDEFSPSLVTWDTAPAAGEKIDSYVFPLASTKSNTMQLIPYFLSSGKYSKTAAKMANAVGLMITGPTYYKTSKYITIAAPMSLRLWVDDQTVTSKPQAAKFASGYVNRHVAQIFTWDLVPDGDYYCYGEWTQASAVFSYRAGTSGEWTTVAVSGSTQAVEIAANTLATGTVQWKVQTTDDQGTTAESEVYTITTTDSAMTATPIAPINTIENGDAAIVFMWDTANDNGNPPTGADLQYSTDGSSWSDLGSVSGAATEYSAAAETFSNGTVYWRVRAYNADSVAGSWSDPVSFVCMAAPPMPVVSATEVPYATISWQSDGQQTYRVTVDGKSYGPYFGTKKSFDLPDYLSDGQHTATVEVQGSSGLWSHPGSVTFSVTNVPGDPVALTGKYSRDAALTWTTDSATADFYVYRDDVRIGHTTGTRFTDRFVLGAHSYYVVNKLPGGYYTRSNLATGTMRSCTRAVAAFAGGGWLEMALSDDSDTEENFSWTMTASERHVTGAAWPVVERSPYTDGSGSYRISFADVETGAAFEALRGQRIIVKSRGGNVVIGVMTGYQKTMTNFYLTYVFTVRRCDWRDYVDAGD